jgi:hypothetical protein
LYNSIYLNEDSNDFSAFNYGQGEYLVFYRSNGKTLAPDRKVYEKAYQILTQYAPMQIANTMGAEYCINCYNLIMSDLKELDPNLESIFYFRQCIEEECAQNLFCRFYLPQEEYKGDLEGFEYYLKEQFALQNISHKITNLF